MKNRLSAITGILTLSAALLLAAPVSSSAQEYQNTPVTVSKDKVKIGGKVCYSHIVLEKQTLYSISKAYNVSMDEIYSCNPDLKEGGLKKNMILIIPLVESTPVAQEPAKTQQQRTHIKKWYEDIEMIARQYGVTSEAIMQANNLRDKKLSNRQKLIIPEAAASEDKVIDIIADNASTQENETADAAEELTPQPKDTVQVDEWAIFPKTTVNATVLLPMKSADGKLSRNNMDFYSGVMLAVHDLGEKGVNSDINVYDIADQSTPVTKADVEDSDIIIGPISSADITRLFQTAPDCGAVVSPLDPRAEKLVSEYNSLIQAPSPHRVQYQDLTNWIKEEAGENDKVFMFSEKTARVSDAVTSMKEVMEASGIEYVPFTYSILEGRDVLEPLKELMTTEGANRVYIASESEAFVNDVVRNLNLMLLENYEVILYAPSKIRTFDTIEVEHFHKTSMRVSLAYYINYDDPAVRSFLLKYRALYNTEPSQFAFQGYDIAHYFISLCSKYGKDWVNMIEQSEKPMLQSSFNYTKQGTGGFVNNGIRRIQYGPKWTITQVK